MAKLQKMLGIGSCLVMLGVFGYATGSKAFITDNWGMSNTSRPELTFQHEELKEPGLLKSFREYVAQEIREILSPEKIRPVSTHQEPNGYMLGNYTLFY